MQETPSRHPYLQYDGGIPVLPIPDMQTRYAIPVLFARTSNQSNVPSHLAQFESHAQRGVLVALRQAGVIRR